MITRKLSIGRKHIILNLRKWRALIIATTQAIGIANETIWNVLKMKANTDVLKTRHGEGDMGVLSVHDYAFI